MWALAQDLSPLTEECAAALTGALWCVLRMGQAEPALQECMEAHPGHVKIVCEVLQVPGLGDAHVNALGGLGCVSLQPGVRCMLSEVAQALMAHMQATDLW